MSKTNLFPKAEARLAAEIGKAWDAMHEARAIGEHFENPQNKAVFWVAEMSERKLLYALLRVRRAAKVQP